jgi:hypothetical protein
MPDAGAEIGVQPDDMNESAPSPADPEPMLPEAEPHYLIRSTSSGKCLTVAQASTADGAPIVQATCADLAEQLFVVTESVDRVELHALHSSQCVSAQLLQAQALRQAPCVGSASQAFELRQSAAGLLEIVTQAPDAYCFDIAEFSLVDGAPIIEWPCWGADNQRWELLPR